MKYVFGSRLPVLWLLSALFLLAGCASTISTYDKVAYIQATSLKVDALALMDKAIKPYSAKTHESVVNELMTKVEKAYEYAKGRPKNKIITKQWFIMKDTKRNLLGGFFVRWKNKGVLSKAIVSGAKSNISLGFDQIIGLESGLIKPTNSQ